MNIIIGDLCVSLVLFIYLKVIGTTNWCIFNCKIMLRILFASSCLYVVCWCITQRRASIYIDSYLNESYVRHVFYVSKHLCGFYYEEKVHYKAWERSNRLSLILMRMTIANNIKTTLYKIESAKEFMGLVGERYQTTAKSLAGILMRR